MHRLVRRGAVVFLVVTALAGWVQAADRPAVPAWEQAGSESWYEGPVLGNGDLGAIVFGASETITLGLGKNDVWERRYDCHLHKPLSLQRFLEMSEHWPTDPKSGRVIIQPEAFVKTGPMRPVKPCPKPVCRVTVELVGPYDEALPLAPVRHRLDLESAELSTTSPRLETVSRIQKDRHLLVLRMNPTGQDRVRVAFFREPDRTGTGIAPPVCELDEDRTALIVQDMPADRLYPDGFRCAVAARVVEEGGREPRLSAGRVVWRRKGAFSLMLAVATTRDVDDPVAAARKVLADAVGEGESTLGKKHRDAWSAFWDASWVRIDDAEVERLWYMHNYLLASAARPGAIAPGLFGPWTVHDTSAWRGGYTMDYNFEQCFAAALSCNRPELLEPYLETIERILPAARQCAREMYECQGLAFPHNIMPIDMRGQWHAYGAYFCETPWTVIHFWEYYLHTQDRTFLRERAYPILAGVADFMADFATDEGDGRYSLFPTKSPEHHHILPGLPFNRNGTPDLGMARYVFQAAIDSAGILDLSDDRVGTWQRVLDGLPDYARARHQLGEVFLDCYATPPDRHFHRPVVAEAGLRPSKLPGNHGPWMTYNCPTSLLHIWPANQIDFDSDPDDLLTAQRTWYTSKYEGSNDLIIRHIVAARLGIPSLAAFKADYAPRLMPNGSITCMMNDLFGQPDHPTIHRYRGNGVYTETFAFPLVINEMMLQSHGGVLKLFPTMDPYRRASFHRLRACGGFLVSASVDRGFTEWVEIEPTVEGPCRVRLPWPAHAVKLCDTQGQAVPFQIDGDDIVFKTTPGQTVRLEPILRKW